MFLAVYTDGNVVKRDTLDEISNLPSNYFLFEKGKNWVVNNSNGLKLIDKKGKELEFFIFKFQVLDIELETYNRVYITIYNKKEKKTYKLFLGRIEAGRILSEIVINLLRANDFNHFSDYLQSIKIDEYLKKIETLQKEIDALKKENVLKDNNNLG